MHRVLTKFRFAATSSMVFLGSQACGPQGYIGAPSKSSGANAEGKKEEVKEEKGEQTCAEAPVPPAEYYDALLQEQLTDAGTNASYGLAGSTPVLYLNFNGTQLQKGFSRGQSFILCRQSASIPSSGISPADQDAIIKRAQEYFDRANVAIQVTNQIPQSGDFTTMIVGGSYGDLGCAESRGTLGVAPLDGGNANRNDIGFAFTKFYSDNETVADTIAHEAAHSYGLDHTSNRKDIMYASTTSEQDGFTTGQVVGRAKVQDGPALLIQALGAKGSTTPTPTTPVTPTAPIAQQPAVPVAPVNPAAPVVPSIPGLPNLPINLGNLPGLGSLASLGNLLPQLNPADILDITNLLPAIKNLIPGGLSGLGGLGGQLPGLDKIVTLIGLAQGAVTPGATGPASPAAGAISGIAGGLAGVLNPNTLTTIGALAGLAGYGSVGAGIAILQGTLNATGGLPAIIPGLSGAAAPRTAATLETLPNFADALELTQVKQMNVLLDSLRGHTQVINANFTGDTRAALISALKVAYSQVYVQNVRP